MHEEALLTLKEKKKKNEEGGWEGGRVGGRFLRPAHETFVFTVKRQRRSSKRKRDKKAQVKINNSAKIKIKQQVI